MRSKVKLLLAIKEISLTATDEMVERVDTVGNLGEDEPSSVGDSEDEPSYAGDSEDESSSVGDSEDESSSVGDSEEEESDPRVQQEVGEIVNAECLAL